MWRPSAFPGSAGTLLVSTLFNAGLPATFGSLTASSATISSLAISALNNTPIGNTTPAAGAFTSLGATGVATLSGGQSFGGSATGTLSGGGLVLNFGTGAATIPSLSITALNNTPVGNTTPSTGAFTTLTATSLNATPIGGTTPAAGAFTTLSATSIDATPIGGTTPAAGKFTTLNVTGGGAFAGTFSGTLNVNAVSTGNLVATSGSIDGIAVGATTPSTGAFTTLSASGAATLNGGASLGSALTGPGLALSPVIATGQTTGDTLANRFSDVLNLKHDCGAKGDGVTDDSGALKACIDAENADYASGKPAVIYAPAGIYYIKSTQIPAFAPGVPGAIVGAGPLQTFFMVDPAYSGNVFAWSEAWMNSSWASPFNPSSNTAGPLVEGFSVVGSTASANTQNAFVFLDRDDHVNMRNVDVLFLHGACVAMGTTLNQTQAYVRESVFKNVKCWGTGTTTAPAVNVSSTTTSSSDATNEVKFNDLDVFDSAGAGVVVSNPNQYGATRLITFNRLRSEDNAYDALDIGLPTDQGQVDDIQVNGFDAQSVASGYYAAKITTGGSNQPYGISIIDGWIGGSGSGVDVDNARLVDLYLSNVATTGQAVTLGANAGSDIMVRGNGSEYGWSYTIPAAVQGNFSLPTLNHALPSSAAIDIQTGTRTADTHFASGTGAFAAGQDNTASGAGDTVGGTANAVSGSHATAFGNSNTVSADNSFVAGYGNSATGSSNFAAGYTNTLSGVLSSAPGGNDANDFGREGWRGQASGEFSTSGDAQFGRMVLRTSTASTAQTELTADGNAAVTSNIPSIQSNSAATVSVSVIARDVTTAGNSYSYVLPAGLLTQSAGVASTAFAATSTADTGSTGTGSTAAVSLSADTAAGGLAVKWTAPNTDAWHVVATVKLTEVK